MYREIKVIFIWAKIKIPKDTRKVIYVTGYGLQTTHDVLIFSNIPSSTSAKRNLKDSLGKLVDVKGKLHGSRK